MVQDSVLTMDHKLIERDDIINTTLGRNTAGLKEEVAGMPSGHGVYRQIRSLHFLPLLILLNLPVLSPVPFIAISNSINNRTLSPYHGTLDDSFHFPPSYRCSFS